MINHRITTPEEEAKLIEAEHANGYCWLPQEKELVKVPKYVRNGDGVVEVGLPTENMGATWYVNGMPGYASIGWLLANKSTREAYEAQEAKKEHKTPSEAINSQKRQEKSIKRLEREVFELREENKRLNIQVENLSKCSTNDIDKVTTEILDVSLRLIGIQLNPVIIDKIIDVVELLEDRGGETDLKDIVKLESEWNN